MNDTGLEGVVHYIDTIGALLIVDLLLSGDNAMVIALACRALPGEQRRRAMVIGTMGAVVLRVLMTLIAGVVLSLPLLKIVGGVLLLVIAVKLLLIEDAAPDATVEANSANLWSAVGTVIAADFIMSVDNVVGLAAVAHGDGWMLTLGLLISMPLLMFGSLFVTTLIQRFPLLVQCGAALLGWIAGDIAMSDALVVDWVRQQSPGLTVVVPLLAAAFVLLESRIIRRTAPGLAPMRTRLERTRVRAPEAPTRPEADAPKALASVPDRLPPSTASVTAPVASPVGADKRAFQRPWSWIRPLPWLLAAGLVITLATRFSMPLPADLQRFDCTGVHAYLQYREGSTELRLTLGSAYANASVRSDGYLKWGDYHMVSTALGLPPPNYLRQKSATTVVVRGGGFADVECTRSPDR
ncbi:TerC family protein [Sphaerotilus sp.]|uniref:TerC family protein n=1 Tax=Sphaerotilus sp. TaxID=2093942 RepID=UPI0034E2A1D0